MALISCYECEKQVSDQAAACPNCGAPVAGRAPKSRSIAVLLAILLGGIGVHKFYLGSPGWGVVYLLFCWSLIPAILGVIEGLGYLSMSDQEFRRQYIASVGDGQSSFDERAMTSVEKARYGRMTPGEQRQFRQLEMWIDSYRRKIDQGAENVESVALWRNRLAGLVAQREEMMK